MRKYIWVVAAVAYLSVSIFIISITPKAEVLRHDAQTYYETAKSLEPLPLWKVWLDTSPSFIDRGYPILLAQIMKITGSRMIFIMQAVNYLAWGCAAFCIYLAHLRIKSKYRNRVSLFMLFSPLYLSFSAKVYSEPIASLGCALLILGVVSKKWLLLALGSILLISVKSIFAPGILLLALWYLYIRKYKQALSIGISLIILSPILISSWSGDRSLYNRAIQVSKISQSYNQIFACVPYFISYPLGQALLPNYQGVCHQNDPTPNMPGYEVNPYIKAKELREKGFTGGIWLSMITENPLKYIAAMGVSLTNFVLVEGVYPSLLLTLPSFMIITLFLSTRVFWSLYLWTYVLLSVRRNWYLALPLIYLFLLVSNFQAEPRYIYPLLPYLYFLVGLRDNKFIR